MDYRIGQGYDIHRLVAGRPLMIGGVAVESPVGSLAHSDGDALLHAIIDALLGAAAMGDIGDHFPPHDPQWQDADSSALLGNILEKLTAAGYAVVNLDATVFLEAPKLYPHKAAIRENLARLLNLPEDAISLKAKTAEKFPPVGTSEAIATAATVLLQRN